MSNLILNTDSYKTSHFSLYPNNCTGQFSYIEARTPNKKIVPFGITLFIKKYLLNKITLDDVFEAEELLKNHGLPFNKDGWLKIINEYDGYLPLSIKAIPEGSLVNSLEPIVTIESTDEDLFWLPSYIETVLQRAIWFPTTIASNDYQNYQVLKKYYEETSDHQELLQFALHDFSARGVSSEETSEIGSLAHLLYFRGTDALSGILAGRKYYNCDMAGFSIPATEHSVQCAYGNENQTTYIEACLNNHNMISIVLDGYDIFRETYTLSEFKDTIVGNNKTVVLRPDSGDPFVVLPQLFTTLEEKFGYTLNSKGYKVLNNVKIIQGDGIDSDMIVKLCEMVKQLGFSAEMLVYGSGGGLIQKVNRDTYSFAQKTSAMKINGLWVDTVKNPITDSGKKSKGGLLHDDRMIEYYNNGKLLINETLDTIRNRLSH
jgi:nicotinamide phosphoribosyltransferase